MPLKVVVPDVTNYNFNEYIYIRGDADTEGSIRFSIDSTKNITQIERSRSGVWNKTSLKVGGGTLWVNEDVGIDSAGHHLITTAVDLHKHFFSHSKFNGQLSTSQAKMIDAYQFTERSVLQPDNSNTFLGTNFEFVFTGSNHALSNKAYLQTDTTISTTPLRIRIYEGSDDTGHLIFDQTYPASDFTASSENSIEIDGYLEVFLGENYFFKITSDTQFSFKTDTTNTFPWFAFDVSLVHEDDMLQTAEWLTGDTFNQGQLTIQDRQVYVCLETGVQTGDFESNSDKWSKLISQDYSDYHSLLAQNAQTTGLVEGGEVTRPTLTTLDWTSGQGYVAQYSDPVNPTTVRVSWDAVTAYTPENLGTNGSYLLLYDDEGNLSEIPVSDYDATVSRNYILFGSFAIFSGIIAQVFNENVNVGYNGVFSFKDFVRDVIGPANIKGNIISANGGNLSIDNSGGLIYILGSNFRNDKEVVDETTIPSASPMYYSRVFREASPSIKITGDGAGLVNVIDPSRYDDGTGTLATMSGIKYTVQVVYITSGGTYIVAYGQEQFISSSLAQEAVLNGTLEYEEYPTLEHFVRRGFIIVKNTETDLDNAIFMADGKFRIGGVSTSSISGVNSPGGSNTNIQFNDNGVFGGSNDFVWYNDKLGIGLTTPTHSLEVAGGNIRAAERAIIGNLEDFTDITTPLTVNITSGDAARFWSGSASVINMEVGSSTRIKFEGTNDNNSIGTHMDKPFQIVTNSIDRMTILGDGKVGFGTSTPSYDFQIEKDSSGALNSILYNSNTGGIADYLVVANGASDIHMISNSSIGSFNGIPIGESGFASPTGDIVFTVGDSGTASEVMRLTTTSMDVIGSISSTIGVDAPEFYNSLGDLKIQPDVQGDVVVFGDTDVGDAELGKMFYVYRKAAEGDSYIRFYINAGGTGVIHSNSVLTMQTAENITINSTQNNIRLNMGDDLGNKSVDFRNDSSVVVASIDSLGDSIFTTVNGLILNEDSNYNIFLGETIPADIGGDNIVVGRGNMLNVTSNAAHYNVILGKDLAPTLEGNSDSNILIGHTIFSALTLATSENIMIGYNLPMINCENADNNTVIGHNSCKDASTFTENVVIGSDAVKGSDNLEKCTVIGRLAGSLNNASLDNVILLGYSCPVPNDTTVDYMNLGGEIQANLDTHVITLSRTTGKPTHSEKLWIDGDTMADGYLNVTGLINGLTIYGDSTNHNIGIDTTIPVDADVVDNIFIGYGTGGTLTEGNDNIVIGNHSATGYTNQYTNIIIGNYSGVSTIGDDNILIGDHVECVNGLTDNCINIGNLIYGDDTTDRLRIGGTAATALRTSAALEVVSTTGAFMPPKLTTTERDALTPVNGMMIYNRTTDKFQGRALNAWVDLN